MAKSRRTKAQLKIEMVKMCENHVTTTTKQNQFLGIRIVIALNLIVDMCTSKPFGPYAIGIRLFSLK